MEGLLKALFVLCFIATCNGSCSDLELSNAGCCTLSDCFSSSDQCYCDVSCYTHDDCCPDITEIGCYPPEAATKCNNTDIRLVGGSNTHEGTVEVCVNGTWGTVCDDEWDNDDAAVVCRQLGIDGVAIARTNAYFGAGTGPINMDNVQCTGNEGFLVNCTYLSTHNCAHFEDAGVSCGVQPECNNTDIRLVGGSNDNEGRVEVCFNEEWGTVCDDDWDNDDAAVVCNQLGIDGAVAFARADAYFGVGTGPIYMDDVHCIGNEGFLTNCNFSSNHNCFHFEDAGVTCGVTPQCNNSDIRLVGGSNDNEGRVEVCVNGLWGTVCSHYWTYREATVVCRQLGINGVSVPRDVSYFGSGTGPISMGTVYCTGNEDNLTQCTVIPQFFCGHFYDVGVSCDSAPECNDTDIRLVGGSNANEGRVEVCSNGTWGTVCGDSWDNDDAIVVCRQLGLGSTGIHRIGHFGPGSGNIVMANVQCSGTEDLLVNCLHYTTHQCSHSQDAGVSCISSSAIITTTTTTSVNSTYKSSSIASMTLVTTPSPSPTCTSGSIRLVGGSNANEGRVEVCINGTWGTVCDDLWGAPDAEVVCRQLGIDGTSIAHTNAHFGAGTGPINMDNVQCTGNEKFLVNCTYLSIHNCGHSEDAGVTCGVQPECNNTDIRLVGGSNANEGRVEVCVDREWGTVCDDGWDNDDAAVVCRQLGLGTNGVSYSSAYYGQGNGSIVMDDVHCDGTEEALVNCSHTSSHNCYHFEDAGVRCIVNSISTSAITPTPSPINNCISGKIRLVGGSNSNEGRVEVCINGTWGTVCDDLWGAPDARVVCNQLGIDGNFIARTNAYFGAGTGPINMDNVQCTGNEGFLVNCTYLSTHNCDHSEDAGVTCGIQPGCNNTDIRLVGGSNANEGRVEVCSNGEWGTVCDDGWDNDDAAVVCRQLGLGTNGVSYSSAYYGSGSGLIVMDDVHCDGTEEVLVNCSHTSDHNCFHNEDAGVRCIVNSISTSAITPTPSPINNCISGNIRLVGGSNSNEGRVEVCVNGYWGTVCDDLWGAPDAAVVCNQLGIDGNFIARTNAYFGAGTGPINMDNVRCTGNEGFLVNCTYSSTHNCDHSEDAGVTCGLQPECNNSDIRLVGGSNANEGRVEVCINGTWGTVCHDFWGSADAAVVCNQLGIDGGAIARTNAYFGAGTGPINMDNVQCTGNEGFLVNCTYSSTHNCGHFKDAGVTCGVQPECNNSDIRLIGGSNANEGRVVMCINDYWYMLCSSTWTVYEASLVCKQLGINGISIPHYGTYFSPGTNPTVLSAHVSCVGNEDNFTQCATGLIPFWFCVNFNVGVTCGVQPECNNTDIRLVGGSNANEGRVEVCSNRVWGTVCDDDWDNDDAAVACRQLGLGTNGVSYSRAYYGQGNGSIVMDEVNCTGTEKSLFQCAYTPIHDCRHYEDAGVKCVVSENSSSSISVIVSQTSTILNTASPSSTPLQGSCLSLNLPYTGCCNSSNGSRTKCYNGCYCDASCYLFGDCCDDIDDIGCILKPSFSISATSSDSFLSSTIRTSKQSSTSTIIKTSVKDSSSTDVPSVSTSFSTMSTPAVVVENALKASIPDINKDTFTDERQSQFKQATANSINKYCSANPDNCIGVSKRKRQNNWTPLTESDIIIFSISNTNDGVDIAFYAATSSETVLPVRALETAVQAGIDDGTYHSYGFDKMTAAPLHANNPTVGGIEKKGGNSTAIIGGVVAFICVALLVIIVIALILTIIMKKRRKDLSRNADYLVDKNLYLDDNKALSATNPCYHSKELDGKEDLSQYYDTVAVDATYSVIKPQAATVICEGDDGYENMSGGQGNEGVYETIASEI